MELNGGVSFGWEVSGGWVVAALVAVGYLLLVEKKDRKGLLLILGGGVGNLASRIRHGGVVDNWRLGNLLANNWADYLIAAGVGYEIIKAWKSRRFMKINKSS